MCVLCRWYVETTERDFFVCVFREEGGEGEARWAEGRGITVANVCSFSVVGWLMFCCDLLCTT